jgi:hypothetical protein
VPQPGVDLGFEAMAASLFFEGARERVGALIASGAPVDPAAWAIEEHDLIDNEIAGAFETTGGQILQRLGGSPTSWFGAPEWREIVAGLAFEPTPGPGYSEGGDVFAP